MVDRDNARVQKFNIEGKCLREIGCHSNMLVYRGSSRGCDLLSYPLGITVHRDNVYVTDQGKQLVLLFNKRNGHFNHTIGTFAQLSKPYDVAVNINNQVLVADRGHQCIFVFNSGLHFRKIGSGESLLKLPSSITTDACGFIFVTVEDRVEILDQYGVFEDFVGGKGAEDERFLCPNGVAVSPNGTVYVSDGNNKRIQIFPYLKY